MLAPVHVLEPLHIYVPFAVLVPEPGLVLGQLRLPIAAVGLLAGGAEALHPTCRPASWPSDPVSASDDLFVV